MDAEAREEGPVHVQVPVAALVAVTGRFTRRAPKVAGAGLRLFLWHALFHTRPFARACARKLSCSTNTYMHKVYFI